MNIRVGESMLLALGSVLIDDHFVSVEHVSNGLPLLAMIMKSIRLFTQFAKL